MKNYFLLPLLLPIIGFSQKPIFVSATVKSATVYNQSALISQNTAVLLPKGNSEIVLKNIANNLNQNTIQIGVPPHVTVLSVQYTTDYISEFEIDEQNPAIKKVRDSIKMVESQIQKTTNSRDADQKTIELLDKNQQVFGNNSGLNVAELGKMVLFYRQNRTELSNTINDKNAKIDSLSILLERLQNQLELSNLQNEKSSKGKLVLQVMNDIAENTNFDINYVANNASWKPMYDLRVDNVAEPINLLYKAQITQNTGIDWKKIKLVLSSGNPNQNNTPPTINSWFLKYKQPIVSDNDAVNNAGYVTRALKGKVAGVQIGDGLVDKSTRIVIRGNRSVSENKEDPMVVIDNVISTLAIYLQINPSRIKSVNVLKGAEGTALYGAQGTNGVMVVTTKQGMDDYISMQENQLNVLFDIDLPYDVLSNNKPHSVELKALKVPASFKSFAIPKAEKAAFLMAEITDYSKFNLLPGEANIIFEGMYVGKTYISTNQTNDTLSLSMGRDKKIAITREKVADKSGTKFLSSKKEQVFTFDITIKNNKKEAVEVTIKDQYPIATDTDSEVELTENSGAKVNSETGILTWNLNLKPSETRKLRFSYKVKYPKDKVFGNL